VAGQLRWPPQRIRTGPSRGDDGLVEPLAEIYAGRIDGGDGPACVGQAIVTGLDPLGADMPTGSGLSEEDIMHPTFVKLFLEADVGELLEEDKRRRANRAKRTRSRMAIRGAACDRERGPRR
jgi:hypothetical protein